MGYTFSDDDLQQIVQHGLQEQQIQQQLIRFKQGYPKAYITEAVTAGGSILQLSDNNSELSLINRYNAFKGSRVKFVPASGAATRLFQQLHQYVREPEQCPNPFPEPLVFYPFASALKALLIRKGENLHLLAADEESSRLRVIEFLLSEEGLGLATLPKALIPFHTYGENDVRTALEEQLVEGALYAADGEGVVNLHFTISPHHVERVKRFYAQVKHKYEAKYEVRYRAQWSVQAASTDTIAVNLDCTPYRDAEGRLVFRPAGHGALLSNLQSLDQDIIFIKNIDNVAPDRFKQETVRYKKALGGLLLKLQDTAHGYLRMLEKGRYTEGQIEEMLEFCRRDLCIRLPMGLKDMALARQCKYLNRILNRPMRVCGMVPNEGAPGGGPFWVRERNGSESLQIVESAQMDLEDPSTEAIVQQAKYFNPVDIVCSIRDYRGAKFNLSEYIDPNAGFIAQKSVAGDPILAMELPGLWNGAMAHWNTVFVHVPSITFTPVKTYHDLLSPFHQTLYIESQMKKE